MKKLVFASAIWTLIAFGGTDISLAPLAHAEIKGLFKLSQPCINQLTTSSSWDEMTNGEHQFFVSCFTTFPFALSTDIMTAPFILTANLAKGNTTEVHSSEKREQAVKEYKKTMIYAVADDAVYFTAGPGRKPSTTLAKLISELRIDFPGETDQQIASRIVQTHLEALEYLSAF